MISFDPYAELGVSRDARPEEIEKAFRRKAKKAHPDLGGTAEAFARLRLAHDILRDEARRAKYDATGDAGETTPAPNPDNNALEWISRIIAVALGAPGEEPWTYDLDKAVVDSLRKHLSEETKNLAKMHRIHDRAKKLRGRFQRKGEGENVIDGIVAWHQSQSQAMIAKVKATMADITRAIELVELHGFRKDSPLQQIVFHQAGGARSGGITGGGFLFGGLGGIF